MNRRISIIVPNYNGSATIGRCLEAAFSSGCKDFEVIVVDDCSTDNSVEIIKQFPCKLIRLDKHSGASRARNIGAGNSGGDILFFIDSDCLLQNGTLSAVNKAFIEYCSETGTSQSPPRLPLTNSLFDNYRKAFFVILNEVKNLILSMTYKNKILRLTPQNDIAGQPPKRGQGGLVIGGTYTKIPYDDNFFSTFQSIFVNYSETKKRAYPDYIATHAMAISRKVFKDAGGFSEDFLPILEDVEFSHRLRKAGYKLLINHDILVRHIFNFTFLKSLRNAFRKSMYWTIYSIKNRDLLADSGTASTELKINMISYLSNLLLLLLNFVSESAIFLIPIPLIFAFNIFTNRKLLLAFYKAKGLSFSIFAIFHYILLYPIAVGSGAFTGALRYALGYVKFTAG